MIMLRREDIRAEASTFLTNLLQGSPWPFDQKYQPGIRTNGDLNKDGRVTHEYLLPNLLSSANRPMFSAWAEVSWSPHEN